MHATPAAPAPDTTTRRSPRLRPVTLAALRNAASTHHRRAVLVVVEHRDVEPLAQPVLDLEAARGGDVLEVDAAERRRDPHDGLDDLVRIGGRRARSGTALRPANSLNSAALPSITGSAAAGPMLPSPSTAVPSLTTATRRDRQV